MTKDNCSPHPSEIDEIITLKVDQPGRRLDRYLADRLPACSRSAAQRLIRDGLVTVDGALPKASYPVAADQRICVKIPRLDTQQLVPQPIPLDIVFEDRLVVVVNKPAGMVVHPAHGNWRGTLVNALLHRYPTLVDDFRDQRPGIVHRLDKDTSGLMVVAKSSEARQHLQDQFKARRVCKGYQALLEGRLSPGKGRIEAAIGRDPHHRKRMAVLSETRGGREAITDFRVVRYYDDFTLIEAEPQTGRTHQIRVHFASVKHPLVGDLVYGRRSQRVRCPRQFLHARRLGFRLPSTNEYAEFSAPLPDDLQSVLHALTSRVLDT